MAGIAGAYGNRVLADGHQPAEQKRQRLEALVDLGFKSDMAGLLAYGLELDPNDDADALIADELLEKGLKDLATVKAVTGEVGANAAMVDARPAIQSLQELAPSLPQVKALLLAKGACAPVVQRRNDCYEDVTALSDDRLTDEELAAKIAENIKSANLSDASVVSFEIAGQKKSFSVLVAHANMDGSIRTLLHNQPHSGFTYCMACSSFLWPLRPPPALVPPGKEIKGKRWNAADISMRAFAAQHQATAAAQQRTCADSGGRASSGSGRSYGGSGRRASGSSGSGSSAGKRVSSDGETSRGQKLPRLAPVPVACINGAEPSADVADHEFFNGLGGWMPVASDSSQLANIRTHLKSRTHTLQMQTLRLLARSGAGHFSWLPKPVAGVRLCPFLVPEPEQLRVLNDNEAVAASAAAAAIPDIADRGVAAAAMAGVTHSEVEAGEEMVGQTQDPPEGDDVGKYNTDGCGVPVGWVCCPKCFSEHPITECCLCDPVKRAVGCYRAVTLGNPRQLFIRCQEHREDYNFSISI